MSVTRLNVEAVEAPTLRVVPPVQETAEAVVSGYAEPPPAPTAPEPTVRDDHESIHAAYAVAARILSVRALLGLSVAGAFIIAVLAILKGGALPLVGLGIYAVLTVVPLAIETRRRA